MSTALLMEEGGDEAYVEMKDDGEDDDKKQCDESMLRTDPHTGLSSAEHGKRLAEFGPNKLPEKERNVCLEYLAHFTGPLAILVWIAAVVEIVLGSVRDPIAFADAGVLVFLNLANGILGICEEKGAGDAIAALQDALSPKCSVVRDGVEISDYDASLLVPGDIVKLVFGQNVPADCRVLGEREIRVDQAALTGESLPKRMVPGDVAKWGSSLTDGETEAVVVATGEYTFFGKTAALINKATGEKGLFQKLLDKVLYALSGIAMVIGVVIFIWLITRPHSEVLSAIAVVVVVLVSSVPIALQVVALTSLSKGATRLASEGAIVKDVFAITVLASMSMLCSDKTGTLTTGKMTMEEPLTMAAFNKAAASTDDPQAAAQLVEDFKGDGDGDASVIQSALLAARWMDEPKDAIDKMLFGKDEVLRGGLETKFKHLEYEPFSPSTKRTVGVVENNATGAKLAFVKGAPQVVLGLCTAMDEKTRAVMLATIESLAIRGVRTLSVAKRAVPDGVEPSEVEGSFTMVGMLTFLDPPREDSKTTIERANALGVGVKMITGDQANIAKDTARKLGLSDNILDAHVLPKGDSVDPESRIADIMEEADGFAEVFPEHKFLIVQTLRLRGLVTGMTGDGVNDAPALKRADVGVAVEGATDAAVAAGDIVLTQPGLSTIVTAIFYSRKIFQRIKNYLIYRLAATFQLIMFIFVAVFFNIEDKNFGGIEQSTSMPSSSPVLTKYCAQRGDINATYDPNDVPAHCMTFGKFCTDFQNNQKMYNNATVPSFLYGTNTDNGGLSVCTAGCEHGVGDIANGDVFGGRCPWAVAFTMPVFTLVIITIINDGCILTISYDKVIPGPKPEVWALGKTATVAGVLGVVAMITSVLVLLFALDNGNPHSGSGSLGLLHSVGVPYFISLGHVQMLMYLKITISDIFTLFSARTVGFFFERRLGYAMLTAVSIGLSISTVLAVYWPLGIGTDPFVADSQGTGLGFNPPKDSFYTSGKDRERNEFPCDDFRPPYTSNTVDRLEACAYIDFTRDVGGYDFGADLNDRDLPGVYLDKANSGSGWGAALFIWIYCMISFLVQDAVKVVSNKAIEKYWSGEEDAKNEATLQHMKNRRKLNEYDDADAKVQAEDGTSFGGRIQDLRSRAASNQLRHRASSASLMNSQQGTQKSLIKAVESSAVIANIMSRLDKLEAALAAK